MVIRMRSEYAAEMMIIKKVYTKKKSGQIKGAFAHTRQIHN